ncbi:MAG TPA: DUF6398 domain-containing protein [Sedimentisphaerales bacterium]|nr:DUF6398 domain-containing protein [Sedimentisphaerales bacterium]
MKKKKTRNQKKGGKRRRAASEEELHERGGAIADLTDAFCDAHLNVEYRELCRDVIDALLDIDFPLDQGSVAGWAGGIVHALGRVNFLHDPSTSPHKTPGEVAEGFGISHGTMTAKSKLIRDALDMVPFDPDWCISAMLEDNPLVWMLEVDGLMIDVRVMPREVQEEAYRLGLIPYIPVDRGEPPSKSDGGTGATIIEFPSNRNKTPGLESRDEPKENTPGLFDGLE